MKRFLKKNRNFTIYTLVGAGISAANILLIYLFIEVLNVPTLTSGVIVVGGLFFLKFFIYKWTGFTQ